MARGTNRQRSGGTHARLTKPVRRPVKKSGVRPVEKSGVRLARAWDVNPTDVLEEALARVPDMELSEELDAEASEKSSREPDVDPDREPNVEPNEESKDDSNDSFEDDSESNVEDSSDDNSEDDPEDDFESDSEDDPEESNSENNPEKSIQESPENALRESSEEENSEDDLGESSGENLGGNSENSLKETLDKTFDEHSEKTSGESPNESFAAHLPSLQACVRIMESMGGHLRHLMSLFKLFGTSSVALVLVLGFVGWLKVDGGQASVRDDSETTPVITVVENVVPKASALLQDASDATRESAEALVDAANASRAGWHEENGDRYYYYTDGAMARGVVEIDGVTVTFDDEGRWMSSRLDAPYISQLPDMPSGCEAVSVTMMLNHAGVDVSKEDVVAQLPYSSDPAEGFTGNVYDEGTYGNGGIVWPSALLELVRNYQGSAVDLTGESWETVRGFIDQGRAVCIWFTNDGLDHTVLLVGYSATTVWVNDPLAEKDVTLDIDDFLRYWEQNGYRALSW